MPDRQRTFEYRLRRLATRQRLTLRKSRTRDEVAGSFGTYRLIDERDVVVFEASRAGEDAALGRVEAYLTDETRPRYRMAHGGEYLWHAALAQL